MEDEDRGELTAVEVKSYFVREKNYLLVRGKFDGMYMDHYLHLMQQGIQNPTGLDAAFKEVLAAFTLHLASLPHGAAVAWTWHLESPLSNLFVAGDNRRNRVTGRIFDQNIRESGRDLLISQSVEAGGEMRSSTVETVGGDFFRAVENFYSQSEQRRARYFMVGEEDFVLITAQPQADEAWVESLDDEAVKRIDQTEVLALLETRRYVFDCGCRRENMIDVLMRLPVEERVEIFDVDPVIRMQCPRCGAWYLLTRDEVGVKG